MGVKTTITLEDVNRLFPSFAFTSLTPTLNGVMDTTYIIENETEAFILKKYEHDIKEPIDIESFGLNTPHLIAYKKDWHIYTKLQGVMPKTIRHFHIQSLARFLAKFHAKSAQLPCSSLFLANYNRNLLLKQTKITFYSYYKKLQQLKNYRQKPDGFIHGDIFKDNTVFHKEKIGVFDFADGGCGSFVFDIAVALISFNSAKRTSYTKLFLQTYNQNAPKKIKLDVLKQEMKMAAKLYALLRIDMDKSTHRVKELMVHF